MASISYWFLSPSLLLAVAGKLRGGDSTVPTPAVDWKKAVVDVVLPAKNEEKAIALALSSLLHQDFPFRDVVVFDDGSSDRTSQVVSRLPVTTSITKPGLMFQQKAQVAY